MCTVKLVNLAIDSGLPPEAAGRTWNMFYLLNSSKVLIFTGSFRPFDLFMIR